MQNIQRRSYIPNDRGSEPTSGLPRAAGVEARAAVAVVGAGIVGLSVAWHLADAGMKDIIVLDRAGVGGGASGVQPGGVRQQWSTRISCEMARESIAFYRAFDARLGGIEDPPRLDRCGYLFLAHSDEVLASYRASAALQQGLGIPTRLLTPEETAALVEGLDPAVVAGASYCGEDGYFDRPQSVVEAFAGAARDRGVALTTGDVAALDQDGSGWQVRLHGGETVRAEQVVLATGYETPELLASLGLSVPIRREPRYLFFSDPIKERLLEPLVVSSERRFAAKQLANGRVLASDLGARGDPEAGQQHWRGHISRSVEELAPRLQLVSFPVLVEGYYDVTPDNQPLLGAVAAFPGLWLAAGFSGHGFMMAPAVGRVVAEAILGTGASSWLEFLSVERFDGQHLAVENQVV